MVLDSDNTETEDLLVVLSQKDSAPLLKPILEAAKRKRIKVAVFLTGQGAGLACQKQLGEQLAMLDTAIVCAESWQIYENEIADAMCRVEFGSQTDHSRLVGDVQRVLSL